MQLRGGEAGGSSKRLPPPAAAVLGRLPATGDVGIWDAKSNRVPVEIVFPGTATDHAALAIGDTWTFTAPLTWADPVPTYLAGQRYTSWAW